MQAIQILALFSLAAIWGASFMFMRIAAPEFGIYTLVLIRTVLAALVLFPFVIYAKTTRAIIAHWRSVAVIGLVNTAIPFVLFNYSSLHLEAGVNAILNATAPMFAAIVAWVWLRDKLPILGILGLLIGFAGVITLSLQQTQLDTVTLLPVLTALGATTCYGISACYIKKSLTDINPIALAAGSQFAASVFLFPAALTDWPDTMPSSAAWGSAITLAVFGTGIAYLLYFYLIGKAGPAKAITVGYLVPLFGIAWGVALLNERLSLQTLAGGGLILLGVMLTTGFIGPKKN
ncbi:DMT family transporter [Alteromonas sediminis]|uniref:DMT family transporter n=1 Tax=Alteromonas sediminis TaxID=2259342 RepID=A0A3N5Z7E4_9ALTE|nr:DMT family transporter [Alteromonas sediminis]RPJ66594.1 DMT family transporter [Alteromonas sediminis]